MSALPTLLALAALTAAGGCGLDAEGEPAGEPPRPSERDTVERVVDGDTVELLSADGGAETVRVRGIDTPETHASRKLDRDVERSALDRETVRALGSAASDHAARLLPRGRPARVEADGRDRYGRLVGNRRSAPATIEADDEFGQPFDVGGRMIADGYAHAYDGGGRYPHPRKDYYRALDPKDGASQRQARDERAGLWAPASLPGGLDALSPP